MIQQDLPHRGAGLLRLRFTARSQADDRKLAAPLQPPPTTRIPGPHPAGRVSCETIPPTSTSDWIRNSRGLHLKNARVTKKYGKQRGVGGDENTGFGGLSRTRPCLETTPTLGKRAKKPQPIRVGFLVNGGGTRNRTRVCFQSQIVTPRP